MCLVLALAPLDSAAQGDGPRNWQLVPDSSKSLTLYGIAVRGNQSGDFSTIVSGAEVDAAISVLQYTRAFAVGADQVQAFASLPFGRIHGTAPAPGGSRSAGSSGLGDATFGALYGLVGSPALSDKEYAAYRPGFTLGGLAKVSAPTGEYDSSNPVNLGTNRWSLQLGAPMVRYFGRSFLDSRLGSLELTPSIQVFTDNNAPRSGNAVRQAPLFKLEGHATRNVSRPLWFSADAFFARGGETTTDGVRDNNAQRWLSLGASAGFNFSDTVSGSVSYGKVVRRNDGGLDMRGLRADAIISF